MDNKVIGSIGVEEYGLEDKLSVKLMDYRDLKSQDCNLTE